MSSKSYIKKAIDRFVEDFSLWGFIDYDNWYVGITNDPSRRYKEHGSKDIWRDWKANSDHSARDLESEFLNKGMNGGPGGGTDATYIYVYKKSGPFT